MRVSKKTLVICISFRIRSSIWMVMKDFSRLSKYLWFCSLNVNQACLGNQPNLSFEITY